MAPWFHHAMLELRDYANEGGKLIVAGRNVHQAFTSTQHRACRRTGPYTWTPDKLFGFYYPPNNGGDDDLPGTAFLRSRTTSNDTWQNYLGVVGRQGGVGVDRGTVSYAGAPVARQGRRPVRRHGADHASIDRAGQRPEPERRRHAAAAAAHPAAPAQLGRGGATNEPLRQERIEADYATDPAQNATGGAIISTRDAVTFGFGLEQVDADARATSCVKRSLSYLLPTTADTTPPTIVGYKYPPANSDGDARTTRSRST